MTLIEAVPLSVMRSGQRVLSTMCVCLNKVWEAGLLNLLLRRKESYKTLCMFVDNEDGAAATERFQDAAAEHQRNVQRHLTKQGSSSPTEDQKVYESSEEEDEMNDDSILQSILKSFQGTGMGKSGKEIISMIVTLHNFIVH